MTEIKDHLTDEIERWAFIGHPALMQRFVLRNGKEYAPTARVGKRGEPKNCFGNSTLAVIERQPARAEWVYVEGYAIHRHNPLLLFHHAWVTTDGDNAMDLTLEDAPNYRYFGVAFDRETLTRELRRTGYYGLLDTGLGMNVELMFRQDPELLAIVEAVKPHFSWRKAVKAVSAVVLAALVLMPHDLQAQQSTVYGSDGRVQQRVLTAPDGSKTIYGADGRVEGRTTTSTSGVTTVYGSSGRATGTIVPSGGRK